METISGSQNSDEVGVSDMENRDDSFEDVSSDEEGYESEYDQRDQFTFDINVDEELIKYAEDF